MDFCMNMNTKANRKKLVRALFIVPRQRSVFGIVICSNVRLTFLLSYFFKMTA
jgi:hypothetical protein